MMRGVAAFASGVILLGSVSRPVPAQDAPCTTRTILATVIDQQGNVVRGLTAANFRGKFRGQPVRILSLAPDNHPQRIVIVLDLSGSMWGEHGEWEIVPELIADAFRIMAAECSFALVVFSGAILESTGFGQTTTTLEKKLAALSREPEKFRKNRKTALYDALMAALVKLSPSVQGDAIFVITDGADNSSKTKPSEMENAFLKAGVRVFAFMPLARIDHRMRTPEEILGPELIQNLVRVKGGNLVSYVSATQYFEPSAEARMQIRTAVSPLYEQMGQYDRLEIRLPAPLEKPRSWKLEVVDENGKPNRNLRALYPKQLMPCQ
jgi:hypothetical protein